MHSLVNINKYLSNSLDIILLYITNIILDLECILDGEWGIDKESKLNILLNLYKEVVSMKKFLGIILALLIFIAGAGLASAGEDAPAPSPSPAPTQPGY
jgi:hypothetical protein